MKQSNSMKPKLLLFLLILLLMSCKNRNDRAIAPPEQKIKWNQIDIRLDQQNFLIYHNSDSAYFTQWDIKRNFIRNKRGPGINYEPSNRKDSIFIFNKSERDSLASYIYALITKPVFATKWVTDYVGNISFQLKNGGTSLSCEYNSVGDWTTISEQTQKIYKLLSSKVGISSN